MVTDFKGRELRDVSMSSLSQRDGPTTKFDLTHKGE